MRLEGRAFNLAPILSMLAVMLIATAGAVSAVTYSRFSIPPGYGIAWPFYWIAVGIGVVGVAALALLQRRWPKAFVAALASVAGIALGGLWTLTGAGAVWYGSRPRTDLGDVALRFASTMTDLLVVSAVLGFAAWAVCLYVSSRPVPLIGPICSILAVGVAIFAVYSADGIWTSAIPPPPSPAPTLVNARQTYGEAVKQWFARVDLDAGKLDKCGDATCRKDALKEYLDGLRTFDRVLRHLAVPTEYDSDLLGLVAANSSLESELIDAINTTDGTFLGNPSREYVAALDLARDLSISGY